MANAYKQVKTRAGFELGIAAFLGELLAAHGDDWRGGWVRCSLKKKGFSGKAVTHAHSRYGMLGSLQDRLVQVRKSGTIARQADPIQGFTKAAGDWPSRASHRTTSQSTLGIEFEMPAELVQLTSPAKPKPTNAITARLRNEVAELNASSANRLFRLHQFDSGRTPLLVIFEDGGGRFRKP